MKGNNGAYVNYLSISHRGKGIPYGGFGEVREDGGANYGFVNLKTQYDLIDSIPELKFDEALRSLIRVLNAKETALFTIGCASSPVQDADGRGHRYEGYVEFALNTRTAAKDASIYFPVFYHFDRFLLACKFHHQVMYVWELAAAGFTDANAEGFTCAITVNTTFFPTAEEARVCWTASLQALEKFLPNVTTEGEPIYEP